MAAIIGIDIRLTGPAGARQAQGEGSGVGDDPGTSEYLSDILGWTGRLPERHLKR